MLDAILRIQKLLHDTGFSRRAACDRQLGWFGDRSGGAILFLEFLLGATFVERRETVSCAGASIWSFSMASDADELSLILDAE